ncbi:MAG: hypothetical protein PT965_02190 [Clostridia bacterium]|nr:hypothetical protein [Clostridia bacterium]MDY2930413.1 hypothetical protein [Clostridiaceae bacterium]
MASLDPFRSHSQLFHEGNGALAVDGLGKHFVGVSPVKRIVQDRFAGFISIPLPPKRPVEKPPDLIDPFAERAEEKIADHLSGCFVYCGHRPLFSDAEGLQKIRRFFRGIRGLAIFHGFLIAQNFLQVVCVRHGELTDDQPVRFDPHCPSPAPFFRISITMNNKNSPP